MSRAIWERWRHTKAQVMSRVWHCDPLANVDAAAPTVATDHQSALQRYSLKCINPKCTQPRSSQQTGHFLFPNLAGNPYSLVVTTAFSWVFVFSHVALGTLPCHPAPPTIEGR